MVKLNHNEFLSYPASYDQVMFGSVEEAWNLGAVAVGATIYFGSEESSRQIIEVAQAFERAHELGMATILWCYTRNSAFKKDGVDYHTACRPYGAGKSPWSYDPSGYHQAKTSYQQWWLSCHQLWENPR